MMSFRDIFEELYQEPQFVISNKKKIDEALKFKKQIKMTIPDGTVIGILF